MCGTIQRWLPAGEDAANEPPLFHVCHDDGDGLRVDRDDAKSASAPFPLAPSPSMAQFTSPPRVFSSTTPSTSDEEERRAIRQGFDRLAESDGLDKVHALELTRLFHAMETVVQRSAHAREREVAELKAELEMARLRSELDRLARRQTMEAFQAQQQQQQNASLPASSGRRR